MYQKQLIYNFLRGSRRLLIILDACRYDTLIENIEILNPIKTKTSKVLSSGSCTKDWLLNTFNKPLDVVYVTANPWVLLLLKNSNVFKAIDDVSTRFWDEKLGTVRAQHVNLVALKYLIKGENLVVHYLQPHPPFVAGTWLEDRSSPPYLAGSKIYELAARNKNARREFRRAYIENLRYVLRYVKRLVQAALRLDYKVVITADHSELLGTYAPLKTLKLMFRKNLVKFLKNWLPYAVGYYHVVGHPCGWVGRELYEVPWVDVYGEA